MRRRARSSAAVVLILCGLLLAPDGAEAKKRHRRKKAAATKAAPANFDRLLPLLGTRLVAFPAGAGKPLAERACLLCHSGDMVAQQRLTEKQWAAEVTKMAVWGADIPLDKREELVAYLVENFGPGAPKYEPVLTRPVGR